MPVIKYFFVILFACQMMPASVSATTIGDTFRDIEASYGSSNDALSNVDVITSSDESSDLPENLGWFRNRLTIENSIHCFTIFMHSAAAGLVVTLIADEAVQACHHVDDPVSLAHMVGGTVATDILASCIAAGYIYSSTKSNQFGLPKYMVALDGLMSGCFFAFSVATYFYAKYCLEPGADSLKLMTVALTLRIAGFLLHVLMANFFRHSAVQTFDVARFEP